MVDLDIIEPIEERTDWVNGPVIVEKPMWKVKYLSRSSTLVQRYKTRTLHLLTVKEIFSQIPGACFSQNQMLSWDISK